jgi:hypothetical protein
MVELGTLGRGAGGMVLAAMHTTTNTVVALKCRASVAVFVRALISIGFQALIFRTRPSATS